MATQRARTPKPRRPLGKAGTEAWRRIWAQHAKWVSRDIDNEFVLVLCETYDERAILRPAVLREGEWRDRVALRNLDAQIISMMGELGFSPTQRKDLQVSDEPAGKLAQLRAIHGGKSAAGQ